ncbi:MAG: hypothetical protein II776_05360, partial [Clostridia bacterium]|nr:hypothetical protein [Clostridia bacterium]
MKRKNNAFAKLKPTLLLVVSSLVLLGASVTLAVLTNSLLPLPVGLIFLLAELVVLWIYGTLSGRARAAGEEQLNILGGVTLDFLMGLGLPCVILGEKGEILWYNQAFQALLPGKSAVYDQNINDVTEEKLSVRRLREDTPEELAQRPVNGRIGGREFEITSYRIATEGKVCLVTVWQSMDRILALTKLLSDRNPVVAYAAVDNFSEAGFSQGNYRTVTAKISMLLKEWANDLGAILREVENDRFILVMEE